MMSLKGMYWSTDETELSQPNSSHGVQQMSQRFHWKFTSPMAAVWICCGALGHLGTQLRISGMSTRKYLWHQLGQGHHFNLDVINSVLSLRDCLFIPSQKIHTVEWSQENVWYVCVIHQYFPDGKLSKDGSCHYHHYSLIIQVQKHMNSKMPWLYMSLCKEALFCLLVSFLMVKKNCSLGMEDVENMTEMDCLKVRKLSQVHLYLVMHSRHHCSLFTIALSWLPSSVRGSYTDRESCADL